MAQGFLWKGYQLLDWLVTRPCPLCQQALAPVGPRISLCGACTSALQLPQQGLTGTAPLPWWAAGFYDGAYRRFLLDLRKHPHQKSVAALVRGMSPPAFPRGVFPLMVPVPSWKKRANPLPGLICAKACQQWRWSSADLLQRSRPVLGQHHLNRALRMENQRGAFHCRQTANPKEARQHPVLLVDDILTSGATALHASVALRQAGWRVHGLICLARTPHRRQPAGGDLRSVGRRGDTPG